MRILVTGGSGFIGTNLLNFFDDNGVIHLNVDIEKPKLEKLVPYWDKCNVNDYHKLEKVIIKFKPEFIINLAAQTDTNLLEQQSHEVNYLGVKNIIKVIDKNRLQCKIIHLSSMLVNDLGTPVDELANLNSSSWYGKSKVKSEMLLKETRGINYCILRPTSIYGPYMGTPYYELFQLSLKKLIIPYPRKMGRRPFGFVGNVVQQVEYVIANFSECSDKSFYLMDSTNLNVKIISTKIRECLGLSLPRSLNNFIFEYLAFLGDFFKLFNLHFPLTSSRYKNLITNQTIPDHLNINLDQDKKISFDQSIVVTINWMKHYKKGFED